MNFRKMLSGRGTLVPARDVICFSFCNLFKVMEESHTSRDEHRKLKIIVQISFNGPQCKKRLAFLAGSERNNDFLTGRAFYFRPTVSLPLTFPFSCSRSA